MSACRACGTPLPPSNGPRPRKWCSDKCRKTQYGGECIDCGARLNGSDGRGPNAAKRCLKCANVANGIARKVWTREAIIAAMREWADEHDGVYPTVCHWNPTHAVALGGRPHPDYVREPDRWPCFHTVHREFGTWRAGVVAAGFTPRERGERLNRKARVAA